MIPQPHNVLYHLRLPHILRIVGRILISDRKILPNHDTEFIAEVVQMLRFEQTATPDANELNAHFLSCFERPAVAFAVQVEQNILRRKIHSFHKQLFTVDDKLPVIPAVAGALSRRGQVLNTAHTVRKFQVINRFVFF